MTLGFNYHPSQSGCGFWRNWNAEEMEQDFKQMSQYGYTIIRFFIFWHDFEPEEGIYDERMFQRLSEFVHLAHRYELQCVPAILTIWMNGQLFDLPWRENRNLWKDPQMVERSAAFVKRVVAELKTHTNIFAYDIGDEMVYIDFETVTGLSERESQEWIGKMTRAVREMDTRAKVWMGSDSLFLLGNHYMTAKHIASDLDWIAIHGFPLWTSFQIESNASVKASQYVPFLVTLASLYGIPIVDEFGLYGASEEVRAAYIRASGASCLLHGAKAIISWCWKDFSSVDKPYHLRPSERFVGFIEESGTAKQSEHAFRECGKLAEALKGDSGSTRSGDLRIGTIREGEREYAG